MEITKVKSGDYHQQIKFKKDGKWGKRGSQRIF